VRRARYVTFQMEEVAIPWDLFRSILARIRSLADAVSVPSRMSNNMPSINVQGLGRRQLRYARKWPEPSIPSRRSSETSHRKAKTTAKRTGALTEALGSRKPDSYHGSLFGWIRAIWEMSA